jgi:hypothetical protein
MNMGIRRSRRAQSSSGYLNCIPDNDFTNIYISGRLVQGVLSKKAE